jgi:transposase-like protein
LGDREHRKKRLTPEQKWQIFLEASRKNTTDAEVCRRWSIAPHQLRVIRERSKDGAFDAFKKDPGVPSATPTSWRSRPSCRASTRPSTSSPSRTPCCGEKQTAFDRAICGTRLPAEVKRWIVGAVTEVKAGGMSMARACEILMIDTRRV